VKKFLLIIGTILTLSCTGCVPQYTPEPPMTQLQIREIQTRDFDTNDSKLVMKSMMNVLQDEGYVLKNVVLDLGLVSAEKNIDVEDPGEAFLYSRHYGPYARWKKQQALEASANVSEFGNKIRVRMTFQAKTIDNLGNPMAVTTVLSPRIYQEFFEKVSKGIFIQQENI
jgi:hypothetical protein